MGYCGCATIADFHARAKMVRVTSAGVRESHPHDVLIAENARLRQKAARPAVTREICMKSVPAADPYPEVGR